MLWNAENGQWEWEREIRWPVRPVAHERADENVSKNGRPPRALLEDLRTKIWLGALMRRLQVMDVPGMRTAFNNYIDRLRKEKVKDKSIIAANSWEREIRWGRYGGGQAEVKSPQWNFRMDVEKLLPGSNAFFERGPADLFSVCVCPSIREACKYVADLAAYHENLSDCGAFGEDRGTWLHNFAEVLITRTKADQTLLPIALTVGVASSRFLDDSQLLLQHLEAGIGEIIRLYGYSRNSCIKSDGITSRDFELGIQEIANAMYICKLSKSNMSGKDTRRPRKGKSKSLRLSITGLPSS